MQTVYLFDGLKIYFQILCILIEVKRTSVLMGRWGGGGGRGGRGGGRLHDFKFGTFICRFPSDGAASKAVKGLKNGLHQSSK